MKFGKATGLAHTGHPREELLLILLSMRLSTTPSAIQPITNIIYMAFLSAVINYNITIYPLYFVRSGQVHINNSVAPYCGDYNNIWSPNYFDQDLSYSMHFRKSFSMANGTDLKWSGLSLRSFYIIIILQKQTWLFNISVIRWKYGSAKMSWVVDGNISSEFSLLSSEEKSLGIYMTTLPDKSLPHSPHNNMRNDFQHPDNLTTNMTICPPD